MDNQQRFELLSAYLDQELSPKEIEEVEQWLKQDDKARRTYQNLLQLRYRLREIPVPCSQFPSEALSSKVATRVRTQRRRQAILWSGGGVAALFLAMITGMFSPTNAPISRLAKDEAAISSNALMIALDQPIVEIPTVPASDNASSSEAKDTSSPLPTP